MMNHPYLKSIDYLKVGTSRQQAAFCELRNLGLFEALKEFTPVLAGTIPLGIDIEGSDLDIICQHDDIAHFNQKVISAFGVKEDFDICSVGVRGVLSVVASFTAENFEVEIFSQNIPVEQQYAVAHLIVESRLLDLAGTEAREEIRRLKQSGLKTEPAFCKFFQINGDPYDELFRLSSLSDRELIAIVKRSCS